MKNNLIKIFIGLLLMLGGWQLSEYASSLISKKDIELKEELCKNAMTTAGFLTDSVTEITMKIGKIKTKMYEYKYFYFVGADEYSAKKTTNLLNEKDSITIWFDKTNVSVYSTTDPCQDLETYKKEKTIGNSTWYYVFGVLGILIGLGLAWGNLKDMIVNAVRGKKK